MDREGDPANGRALPTGSQLGRQAPATLGHRRRLRSRPQVRPWLPPVGRPPRQRQVAARRRCPSPPDDKTRVTTRDNTGDKSLAI